MKRSAASASASADELPAICSGMVSEIAFDGAEPRKHIMLLPLGEHRPKSGSPKIIRISDKAHGDRVIAATLAKLGKSDVMFDYDHQAPRAPGVAGTAKAAGWIDPKSLVTKDDGIWGDVEWTPAAAAALKAREYRYSSPFFYHDRAGNVTRIVNMALTNTPDLDMPALASLLGTTAVSNQEEDDDMDLSKIASALGLKDDASVAAIAAAIVPIKAKADEFDKCASALDVKLEGEAPELAAVASAIGALKSTKDGNPDPAKFIGVEVVEEMKATMSSMKDRLDAADAKERQQLLDDAQADGRITPATRKHYDDNFAEVAKLASVLADLPKSKLGGAQVPAKKPEADEAEFGDEQAAICSQLGVTKEEYLKAQKGDA